jgi:hypothetical protein
MFSSNVIVRNVGGKQLKISDTSAIQSTGNINQTRYVDRYARVWKTNRSSLMNVFSGADHVHGGYIRRELYTDYEYMDKHPIISAALDIYADECTVVNEYGDILTINSENETIKRILHNLFYDILNIEFNLWPWIRNMAKYGDFFMFLDIQEQYGIINVLPFSGYEMYRIEGIDEDPFKVKFIKMDGYGKTDYDNFEIAHFRLMADANYLPYGRSMLEPARRLWKQVTLMEDAMMIHRIMRAPEKRVVKIDVGNIPPHEVDNYMNRVIDEMKKVPYIDQQTGDYNLKYNMMNMLEDYYLPVRGGQTGTEIDTLSGLEYNGIDDVKYLQEQMFSALKIPRAFLGYDETVNGKATLAAEDVRFARTIMRLQKIAISELTKIAIVHLAAQGYEDEQLVNFSLSLTPPSLVFEQEKLAIWDSKVDLAAKMREEKLLPNDFIYSQLFNFSQNDIENIEAKLVEQSKTKFRLNQIEQEGNDPTVTKESFGTPHDIASMHVSQRNAGDTLFEPNGEAGRPEGSNNTYGSKRSNFDRDPLGKKDLGKLFNRDASPMRNQYKTSPIQAEQRQIDNMIKTLKNKKSKNVIAESLKSTNTAPESFMDDNNIIGNG